MPSNYTLKNGTYRGKTKYKPNPNHYLYNIDTFWFNVKAKNYQEVLDNYLRDLLVDGREYMQTNDDFKQIEIEHPNYSNPFIFDIREGQPPRYQYSIRNEDIAIYFAKNEQENVFPMKVQINQFILWDKGVQNAFEECLTLLACLGFHYSQARLNRVDFAVHSDQFTWSLDDLKTFDYPKSFKGDNYPNFIRLNPITGEFGTCYVGSRDNLFMRIYNKSKEAYDKEKKYFLQMYDDHGMDKYNVWNVEIECRRKYLKALKEETNINLFDDLEQVFRDNGLSKLWTHLMSKFSHDSAHWKQIKKGKEGIFEDCVGFLTRSQDIDNSLEREVAQIRGRLRKFALTEKHNDLPSAIRKFIKMNEEYEKNKEKNFEKEVVTQKRKYFDSEINDLSPYDFLEKKPNLLID